MDVRIFFYFFLLGGEGKGESKVPGGGGGGFFLWKIPGGGVFRVGRGRWGGARGREGVCGELGGGANIFFRGRNSHQVVITLIDIDHIDLLMGLLRGAVLRHGGVPANSPLSSRVKCQSAPWP